MRGDRACGTCCWLCDGAGLLPRGNAAAAAATAAAATAVDAAADAADAEVAGSRGRRVLPCAGGAALLPRGGPCAKHAALAPVVTGSGRMLLLSGRRVGGQQFDFFKLSPDGAKGPTTNLQCGRIFLAIRMNIVDPASGSIMVQTHVLGSSFRTCLDAARTKPPQAVISSY